MANTYQLIEAKTLASAAASVEFTSIPSTYTDLKISISCRGDAFPSPYNTPLAYQFNGTTSGYTARDVYGQGSGGTFSGSYTTTSISGTNYGRLGDGGMPTPSQTSNTFQNGDLYIPNYLSSNYKSFSYDFVPEDNASTVFNTTLLAGLWSNTAAITSIKLAPASGSFVTYSSFYLYGIKNS